jgi:ABC-type dipeptide/oligopeptide/nickel transport system permease component/ABC-type transport system substrate-binding protein
MVNKLTELIEGSPVLRYGSRIVVTGVGFAALLWLCGWVVRPDLEAEPTQYSEAELRAAAELRDNSIAADNRPRIQVEVDYSEGPAADWYPKGESPLLAELVAQGKLPPVEERVGPEPIVYRGVEGIGTYGGTWVRSITNNEFRGKMIYELGCGNLLRFSPHGYPAVPHLIKSYEVSDDNRVFTFRLRKLRWSDGHPFTADDIMFWWEGWATWSDSETGDQLGWVPEIVKVRGKEGRIEKVDDHTVQYIFPEPNGIFLEFMTGGRGSAFQPLPAHYLRPLHPEFGDPEKIQEMMEAWEKPSAISVFKYAHREMENNPELPTLGPFIMRTYRSGGPYTLVRNPYYYAVDEQGNQLPYLDRIVFQVKNKKMVDISVVNGESSIQEATNFNDYTELMTQRHRNGYEVYHWYPARRSLFAIALNLNRKVDDAESARKHELLNDRRFRQALSLAIDRQAIIDAEWLGFGEPAQIAPGPASEYAYPKLAKAFTEFDPKRAGIILDQIGLTEHDGEGFRRFADGSRMLFYLNVDQSTNVMGAVQMVVEHWADVGVRVVPRERSAQLFGTEKFALMPDMMTMEDGSSHNAVGGGNFMPQNAHSPWASAWGRWYWMDGQIGSPKADIVTDIPPEGHPILESMRLYDVASTVVDPRDRMKVYEPALDIAAENLWSISIATPPPVLMVVKKGLRNVPRSLVWGFIDGQFLNVAYPETWFWEEPSYAPGERAEILREIQVITPRPPRAPIGTEAAAGSHELAGIGSKLLDVIASILSWLLIAAALTGLGFLAVKHPYVGRRLIIMIPTLIIISVITFTIIQLPPGNFIDAYIQYRANQGEELAAGEIEEMEEMFFIKDSVPVQYARWMGIKWFVTFDDGDKGLLQGNLGQSMEFRKPVNDIVGDRIILTILISLGTILFTWMAAVPIGIYSAVRQYSLGDYVLTFVGFIGMCVPQFLLALVLIYVSDHFFGIKVTGLFSAEYAVQPEWNWGKVVDLAQHIWLPVIVLGVGGTAGMIRVMRANLLDELRKPYVTTARAKGVRPLKLLMKYPVRLALNPFVSGIGTLFPMLISGGAIVAMVLSLPTVGPLMLSALLSEDMYLAGSMLMVLSVLGVLGVLVSDLLLLWLDPRIRFEEGGSK